MNPSQHLATKTLPLECLNALQLDELHSILIGIDQLLTSKLPEI